MQHESIKRGISTKCFDFLVPASSSCLAPNEEKNCEGGKNFAVGSSDVKLVSRPKITFQELQLRLRASD